MANDCVTVEAYSGEIHAIVGENGAGKTTLMKILAGIERPNSGTISIDGRPVSFRGPRDAAEAGIGMVHQHFSLVRALTVAENLALSDRGGGFLFSAKRYARVLEAQARSLGFELRADAPVWKLSMGERQRVEVLRLVLRGSRVLILDEPTSVLAPHEAEVLYAHLRRLAGEGHTIFLVTHKVQQILAAADRVSVLRRGRLVVSHEAHGLDETELTKLMVGQALPAEGTREPSKLRDDVALRVTDLSVPAGITPLGLSGVSFEVRAGEIFGVAGISGNGQDELVAALVGTTAFKGTIWSASPLDKVAYIPADRLTMGVAASLPLEENLALRRYRMPGLSRGPFLRRKAFRVFSEQLIADLGIVPSSPLLPIEHFSGGNAQKAVLARELAENPSLIVAESPTAGLDIATVGLVHRLLLEQAARGAAVLLVSEDLDELLVLADRILVLCEGRFAGVFPPDAGARIEIGLVMTGASGARREAADWGKPQGISA
ncbi:MAG TPA: ABC transporter ATP-binding protein [Thermoanaerobaculia bacterium]|nr:ABC transporter ATP-binding protein [Thermoanaerobaculia bacterium]